jgi:8-oxo-dGTP pyrophosphatase MutT (NUDIX family)
MSSAKKQVVAAIIERGGRFLVGKRGLHKASAPGAWCTITGCIEPGETETEAVAREVLEETGLRVQPIEKICQSDTRDGTACMHWWLTAPLDDAPAQLLDDEHSELRWVTVEEMRRLEPVFLEDVEIFARLVARNDPHSGGSRGSKDLG